jgi:hypothetical protein
MLLQRENPVIAAAATMLATIARIARC